MNRALHCALYECQEWRIKASKGDGYGHKLSAYAVNAEENNFQHFPDQLSFPHLYTCSWKHNQHGILRPVTVLWLSWWFMKSTNPQFSCNFALVGGVNSFSFHCLVKYLFRQVHDYSGCYEGRSQQWIFYDQSSFCLGKSFSGPYDKRRCTWNFKH